MLIIKHRKVFGGYLMILGILVLLFLACAPKQTEIPKQYTPPELTDEDLEIEEDIEMIEDLEDLDTAEPKAKENE
jgi:hypothetical protein|tara:strand:+ start:117 stop:341 length:225 start_codon:yes stop_codon:yes gene_type:complete